jgi:4-diphosphocytidyl-2-C-methyl-D-erythritol kinase
LLRVARVVIGLSKRVPIGAGLGGGSSDAAHTLVGLDRLLASNWSAKRLSGFAARFGSDVPFFVEAAVRGASSAACRGRGELVRPVMRPAARWAVIFSPPFALATRDVYARFDAMGLGHDPTLDPAAEPDWASWAALPARELMGRLVNDLEPPAFAIGPALAELRAELSGSIGRVVRMSGSGSSLFTLFDADEESAAREAAAVATGKGMTAVVAEVTPTPRVTN